MRGASLWGFIGWGSNGSFEQFTFNKRCSAGDPFPALRLHSYNPDYSIILSPLAIQNDDVSPTTKSFLRASAFFLESAYEQGVEVNAEEDSRDRGPCHCLPFPGSSLPPLPPSGKDGSVSELS